MVITQVFRRNYDEHGPWVTVDSRLQGRQRRDSHPSIELVDYFVGKQGLQVLWDNPQPRQFCVVWDVVPA